MAVAVAELPSRVRISVPVSTAGIDVLVVHECSLFRVGLRSLLEQHGECRLVGETTCFEDVLLLAREEQPAIVLLDGGLTSADPLDLTQRLRQVGVPGIIIFAPETGDEETLFRFLQYGAMAYVDPYLSGDELLAMMRRVAWGEYLITSDVPVAQAARRECRARLRQEALLAASLAEFRQLAQQEGDTQCPVSEADALLSARECAVLEHIAQGGTNAWVAQALGISAHTIKNHLNEIYRKLGVSDRTSAVVRAIREQWIPLQSLRSR